jgi:putative transposase
MLVNTKQRKKAMGGYREVSGQEKSLNMLVDIINNGKQALDALMLDMGRSIAESIMLIEREEISGPDYYPTSPRIQKWSYEESSVYAGDQKIKVKRPRVRDVVHGEIGLKSYQALRKKDQFSEEILEKILRVVSAQKYEETVIESAKAFGVSPSAISSKVVEMTGKKLREFQERDLSGFNAFTIFLDTIHRGGEAFLVALGIDISGEKMALGFWEGSSENHEICNELFARLEERGLSLSKRILYITDGGKGIIKALKDRFGKKLLHQRCAIHKSRNLQKHLPKKYRKEAHKRLMTALEQNAYADARQMLIELEKWLRSKNESAADSLLEAFEELMTLHRLKVRNCSVLLPCI